MHKTLLLIQCELQVYHTSCSPSAAVSTALIWTVIFSNMAVTCSSASFINLGSIAVSQMMIILPKSLRLSATDAYLFQHFRLLYWRSTGHFTLLLRNDTTRKTFLAHLSLVEEGNSITISCMEDLRSVVHFPLFCQLKSCEENVLPFH